MSSFCHATLKTDQKKASQRILLEEWKKFTTIELLVINRRLKLPKQLALFLEKIKKKPRKTQFTFGDFHPTRIFQSSKNLPLLHISLDLKYYQESVKFTGNITRNLVKQDKELFSQVTLYQRKINKCGIEKRKGRVIPLYQESDKPIRERRQQ